jgi:hypothetical protein
MHHCAYVSLLRYGLRGMKKLIAAQQSSTNLITLSRTTQRVLKWFPSEQPWRGCNTLDGLTVLKRWKEETPRTNRPGNGDVEH